MPVNFETRHAELIALLPAVIEFVLDQGTELRIADQIRIRYDGRCDQRCPRIEGPISDAAGAGLRCSVKDSERHHGSLTSVAAPVVLARLEADLRTLLALGDTVNIGDVSTSP
jgi:hypothetical protein